jgi:hypothetical protein
MDTDLFILNKVGEAKRNMQRVTAMNCAIRIKARMKYYAVGTDAVDTEIHQVLNAIYMGIVEDYDLKI